VDKEDNKDYKLAHAEIQDFVQHPVWVAWKKMLLERRNVLIAEVLGMDIPQCKEINLINEFLGYPKTLRNGLKEE